MRWLAPLLALLSAAEAGGQNLAERVRGVGTGTVRMAYAAREGVCGDGRDIWFDDGSHISFSGHQQGLSHDRGKWGRVRCDSALVRVALSVREGSVSRARVFVGGTWQGEADLDLGRVSSARAARTLVGFLDEIVDDADQAIVAAVIADSADVWRELLRFARDDSRLRQSRRSAIFWLAHAAGDSAAAGLRDIVESDDERDIRNAAVFGLSQLPRNTGVPLLIDVARTHRDPQIRRTAFFWLGQSGDRRAIDLIEATLLGPRR